ncbi:MAG: class I adenylate cyclase [Succinivibrio sp.]
MEKTEFEYRLSKVEALNQNRLKLAERLMHKNVVDILNLVPLLLHYNHPNLPGYRDNDVPSGIDLYEPQKQQLEYLKEHGVELEILPDNKRSIYALYAMGSTSSIAQGKHSDLDIWVCVSKTLSSSQLKALSDKCYFISAFAKNLGADVNLFVTAEDRFTSGEHGTMDTEDCGSAQSLFLLDEFYRSAIRLCGRKIAWFMISMEEEIEDYSRYQKEFFESGYINTDEWFDFGSVAKCSPVEYFGSGLWLVYKGIDHPLKAVLKILLMETYADEYPNTSLLSMELKNLIYSRKKFGLHHDAYFLMYRKVYNFLKRKNDSERLHLANICFFLKLKQATMHIGKSKIIKSREKLIDRLTYVWGWSRGYANLIGNIDQWSISMVRKIQNELFYSLLESYQSLLRFSVDNRIEYAITSDDAGVLSRKIYAAFDRYPGKIILTNKEFMYLLEENRITFVKPSKNSICRQGWHAYPKAADDIEILSTKAVYISSRAVEMVAWATLNHLLTSRSHVDVVDTDSSVTSEKIRQLSYDISLFLKNYDMRVSESSLQKPRYIEKVMLLLNFEKDITEELLISPSDIEIGSTLSCGRQRMCLVGSVDLIFLNSWREITCNSYQEGENGIVEALATIVRIQSQETNSEYHEYPSNIKIYSYSRSHRDLIRFDFEAVVRGVFSCTKDYESNFVFNIGHNTYEASVNDDNEISIIRHSVFRTSDDDVTILSRFGMRPEYALQVPSLVEKCATVGIMQYFFKKEDDSWVIYIANERNEVKIYHNYSGSREELVNAINRFHTQNTESNQGCSLNFNLPQYFVLEEDESYIYPYTIEGN